MSQQVSSLSDTTVDSTPARGLTACLGLLVHVGRNPAELVTVAASATGPPLLPACSARSRTPHSALTTGGGMDTMGKDVGSSPGQRGGPSLLCSPSRWQLLRWHSSCQCSGHQPGGHGYPPTLSQGQCEPFMNCRPLPPEDSGRPVCRA